MGGTSTDVCLIERGEPRVRRETMVGNVTVRVSSLDVRSVGAGGGSIAKVPALTRALRVGPESAGAEPGPAAYGRGGAQPTVTDANVILGYLPIDLLGGEMKLDRGAAQGAVAKIASALGIGAMEAAAGIIDVVNEHMFGALRLASVEQGYDPRCFALVAFGGAGPLHANALMDLLGSPVAVVPAAPGVFSTYGFLVADVQREFSRSYVRRLSRVNERELLDVLAELSGAAATWLTSRGFGEGDRELSFQIGMRYFRQGYELPIAHEDPAGDPKLLETLADRFVEAHLRTYQFELAFEPELVVVRCVAAGRKPMPGAPQKDASPSAEAERAIADGDHRIYWAGEWVGAPLYDRTRLEPGHELAGPAVIEQEDSTTLVHPGARVRVDGLSNVLIERLP
jgi:N-methylhydantoinase A